MPPGRAVSFMLVEQRAGAAVAKRWAKRSERLATAGLKDREPGGRHRGGICMKVHQLRTESDRRSLGYLSRDSWRLGKKAQGRMRCPFDAEGALLKAARATHGGPPVPARTGPAPTGQGLPLAQSRAWAVPGASSRLPIQTSSSNNGPRPAPQRLPQAWFPPSRSTSPFGAPATPGRSLRAARRPGLVERPGN